MKLNADLRYTIAVGIIILAGLISYLVSLDAPLLFDDIPNLSGNPLLRIDGGSFDEWRTAALSSNASPLRRPLAMLSFAANYVVAGEFVPWQLKLVNLMLHIGCAILVYLLACQLTRTPALRQLFTPASGRWFAVLSATVWLLHPLHVSTVLYSIQRMSQLSALWMLAGLLVYFHYRLRWTRASPRLDELIAAALWLGLLTLVATLSKENGVLLPWLVFVSEAVLFGGLLAGHSQRRVSLAAGILALAPAVVLLALWAWPPAFVMERYSGREFTLDERMLTQGRLLWHYLGWFFWPDISAMGFQHDDIKLSTSWLQPPSTALAWLAWIALGMTAYLLRTRFPLLLYGFALFLVGHALESTIWPLEMAYEHRNYLPTVGLAFLLGGFLHKVALSLPQLRIQMLGILVMLPLATGLALRTTAWSDTFSRVRMDVSNHPASPRTHYFAGQAQFLQHESGESDYWGHENSLDLLLASRYQFEAMIALDPRDLAPLVMLYQIDKQYLPEMPDANDWMQRIATLLEDRRLQASDYAALKTLSRFFRERPQHADFARFVSIVDALRARYPQSVSLIMLRYDLTAGVDDNILEQRALLEQARLAAPGYLEIYPTELMLARDNGDVAGVYQAGLRWLQADRLREHLPQLKRAFYGIAPQ